MMNIIYIEQIPCRNLLYFDVYCNRAETAVYIRYIP